MRHQWITFPQLGRVGFDSEELSSPGPGQVQIHTRLSLVSPGTELAYFEGKHSQFTGGQASFPCGAPGYSNIGVIGEVGPGVVDWQPGQTVFSTAGHTDYDVVNTSELMALPHGLAEAPAAFTMVGAIALHGVRSAELQFGETVCIIGQGLIGQLAVRLARLCGVARIIAVDMYQSRLTLAAAGGADHTVLIPADDLTTTVAEITAGRGCQAVIEASGNPQAIAGALKVAANRGRVILLGSPHGVVELDLYTELHRKELRLQGAYQPNCPPESTPYSPWSQHGNRALFLRCLQERRLDVVPLITHRMPYQRAQEMYDALARDKAHALAGLFTWSED